MRQMGITEYLGGKRSHEADIIDRFQQKKGAAQTKEEVRSVEEALLKPVKLQSYLGATPGVGPIERRTLKIIFASEDDLATFGNHFAVSHYKENNVRDISLLNAFIQCLEEGSLAWNENEKRIEFVNDRKEHFAL